MAERRNWTRQETLLAFRLYCYTPFGKLHQHNPDIITLAQSIGRTPSAVAMKACNFASLDPLHQSRGVAGLANRSQIEERIWEEFQQDSEAIADEAEQAQESVSMASDVVAEAPAATPSPEGPTETFRVVRTRRVQSFFRTAVLTSYGNRCALTGLAVTPLLNASHILPWAVSEERRADPANGLSLNALHDRAFDRGLITFDKQHRMVVSRALGDDEALGRLASTFKVGEGARLSLPERFQPSDEAMAYHREHVFQEA